MAVDWNAEAANEPEVRGKVARLERKPALLPAMPRSQPGRDVTNGTMYGGRISTSPTVPLLVERAVSDGRIKSTKTGASRTVNLTCRFADTLSRWQATCEADALVEGRGTLPRGCSPLRLPPRSTTRAWRDGSALSSYAPNFPTIPPMICAIPSLRTSDHLRLGADGPREPSDHAPSLRALDSSRRQATH